MYGLSTDLANIWISLGKVAENMRVCLLPAGGMLSCSTILLIWGSKPMSSILSASSRQRWLQNSRLILPLSRKSTSLPGVAIRR